MRNVLRVATLTVAAPLVVALASPAFAQRLDDGEDPGTRLTTTETLLLFVGLPLLVVGLIWVLVWTAADRRRRVGVPAAGEPAALSWWTAPVWFNGPAEGTREAVVAAAVPAGGEGGARARW